MLVVGVRELKNNASRIVRAVREEHAEYVVTVGGRPVAVLRPYSADDETAWRSADVDAYMARLENTAQAVAAAWRGPATAAEAVSRQRR